MEYGIIFIFFFICLILSIVLIILSNILIIRDKDLEKISPYECGFNPFEDARQKFDVRFYLVGILFIIFDLEVSFLFPWSITFSYLPIFAYINMIIFLFILTVGFFYEWYYGALDWE